MDNADSCLAALAPFIVHLANSISTAPLDTNEKAKLAAMVATGFCTAAVSHSMTARQNENPTPTKAEVTDKLMEFIGTIIKAPSAKLN